MKSFLKYGALFFLFFFIIEKSVLFVLWKAPEYEKDRRLECVLEGKMNKDLIVLGSSKGASNILASQLENETGLASYNLSYEGSHIVFHHFILKTLIKHNTAPKKIVLLIDTHYQFINEPSLVFRYDRLYPLSKYNHINDELIQKGKKNMLSKFFALSRVNRSNFQYSKKEINQYNPFDNSGSRPYVKRNLKKKFEYLDDTEPYNPEFELKEKIEAFNNIQKLCSVNDIELICVIPPNYSTYNATFVQRFKVLLKPESKWVVYDTLNSIYKQKEYYYDQSHLFKNGASIFTSEISDFIKNNSN